MGDVRGDHVSDQVGSKSTRRDIKPSTEERQDMYGAKDFDLVLQALVRSGVRSSDFRLSSPNPPPSQLPHVQQEVKSVRFSVHLSETMCSMR